jgi:hypothetical protein
MTGLESGSNVFKSIGTETNPERTGFVQLPSSLNTAMVSVNLAAVSGKWRRQETGRP